MAAEHACGGCMTTTTTRVALGVGLSAAILLVYGLFRPGSLEFSIAS